MEFFIRVVAIWSTIDAIIAFFMILSADDESVRARYGGTLIQSLILAIWGWVILNG